MFSSKQSYSGSVATLDMTEDTRPRTGRSEPVASAVVGVSGAVRNGALAVAVGGELRAFSELERLTRVRNTGVAQNGFPVDALHAVLNVAGLSASGIRTYVTAEESIASELPPALPRVAVDHHFAHAASSFFISPFSEAAVIVCDHHSTPPVSLWVGRGGRLEPAPWAWSAEGFAAIYAEASRCFGFRPAQEHRLEALARLGGEVADDRFAPYLAYADRALRVDPQWKAQLLDWASRAQSLTEQAALAASFQRHLGNLLLAFVADCRSAVDVPNLCVAGGLFYNTYFNTLVAREGRFENVFVPPNPGNPGLAAGAALAIDADAPNRTRPARAPLFLGPQYDPHSIKLVLDNCKLSYECVSDGELVKATVDALSEGRLVGWFQGRMEWGHRALGNRSILASPFHPYVLENLNVYLKKREAHRAYGLSVREADAERFFVGPAQSRSMEYEYEPRDRERLRHVLPGGATRLRVQTVDRSQELFSELHRAFAVETGVGVLVNTSFNAFSEPIVCSPRDAIRVFFGTGIDLLVLGNFIIRK
jgi:carbamoyltransferase